MVTFINCLRKFEWSPTTRISCEETSDFQSHKQCSKQHWKSKVHPESFWSIIATDFRGCLFARIGSLSFNWPGYLFLVCCHRGPATGNFCSSYPAEMTITILQVYERTILCCVEIPPEWISRDCDAGGNSQGCEGEEVKNVSFWAFMTLWALLFLTILGIAAHFLWSLHKIHWDSNWDCNRFCWPRFAIFLSVQSWKRPAHLSAVDHPAITHFLPP